MTTPTKLIVNCSTGERTVVELTADEIAERDAMAAQAAQDEAARQAEAGGCPQHKNRDREYWQKGIGTRAGFSSKVNGCILMVTMA